MIQKLFITLFSVAILFISVPSLVLASGATTDFGSCLNPQVKASQVNKSDRFGVVGTTKVYSGVDSIYLYSKGNVMQCLCQKDGKGIQTNWLKVGSMSKKDVDSYKKSGWIYIITGSTWGLSDEPYLAKNIEYTCKGNVVKETKVKGLAATGSIVGIYGLILAGFVALFAGVLLKRVSK